MSTSPEDSGRLEKLISLKRHEQPPPGYFAHFSDRVIARIEAELLAQRGPWWRRAWAGMDSRPLVACGYGCAVVGLLVIGLRIWPTVEPESASESVVLSPWYAGAPETSRAVFLGNASVIPAIERSDSYSSVTPVISSTAPSFLFDVNRLKSAQPISHSFH